jgi:hypothetical protein
MTGAPETAVPIHRLCVFCGSSFGREPGYRRLAEALARALAGRGIGIVYGGARVGRMGALADAALAAGAEVIGVIPRVWTWAQLGLHAKPCALLDTDGFYGPLVAFLDHLVDTGFVRAAHRAMLLTAHSPEELVAAFAAYRPPRVGKWLEAPAAHLD